MGRRAALRGERKREKGKRGYGEAIETKEGEVVEELKIMNFH
jgi:hypothetical protein